jgi:hypothetical protein
LIYKYIKKGVSLPVELKRPSPLIAAIGLFLLGGLRAAWADTYAVTNTEASGAGSLAQAILDSNARTGQDTVLFNIPGSGVHLIDLSKTPLPDITDSLILDGYTQPGAHPNTLSVGNNAVILIQLDGGSNKSGSRGLGITGANGANCLIRGLAITGFLSAPDPTPPYGGPVGGFGIQLKSSGTGNVVQGNFIGLNPDGLTATGNYIGVRVEAAQSTIGGAAPAARNVISGNTEGVAIYYPATGVVAGNYVGTDAAGMRAAGNGVGLEVGTSDIVLGGTVAGSGNLISGNGFTGIDLGSEPYFRFVVSADRTLVQGNLIGTKADGAGPLGNGSSGIYFLRSSNSTIGGLDPGAGNVIAFNGQGVGVFGTGNRILSNSIYGNNSRGIILGNASANNAQSFPVITSESVSNGTATVSGTLQSAPNTQFLVQLFADSQSLTTSKQTYLGSTNVMTDGSGNGSFSANFPLSDSNVVFNATTTDPSGNTSDFSRNPAYLQNLSARATVGIGDDVLIGGLIMQYGQIVLRGIGPSLRPLGLTNALADPTLEFHDGTGAQMFNDNWKDDQSQATQIQQSGLAPTADAESAIVPFGFAASPFRAVSGFAPFTAILRGKGDTTGIGVVEAYGFVSSNYGFSPKLANISARGLVGTGDNVIIGGFIIGGGSENPRIVVRAIGPSLKAAGIANPLPDPVLELHDGNGVAITSNDNWADAQKNDLQTVGLAPTDGMESAILLRLAPGAYTAIVRGKDNATGIALVEVYSLP